AESLFFSLCCSNRSAVHVDSRLHCSEDRHLLWLGGQYGEKSEDEVRGEEDCEEDQAQNAQEEVVSAASTRRLARCRAWRRICRRPRGQQAHGCGGPRRQSRRRRASARSRAQPSWPAIGGSAQRRLRSLLRSSASCHGVERGGRRAGSRSNSSAGSILERSLTPSAPPRAFLFDA